MRERDVHLLRIEEAAQRVVARGQLGGALGHAILQLRVRAAQLLLLVEPLGLIDQETRHADGAPVLKDRLCITAGGKRRAVAPHKSVPLACGGPVLAGDDASPVGNHTGPVLLRHQIHEMDALRDHGRGEPAGLVTLPVEQQEVSLHIHLEDHLGQRVHQRTVFLLAGSQRTLRARALDRLGAQPLVAARQLLGALPHAQLQLLLGPLHERLGLLGHLDVGEHAHHARRAVGIGGVVAAIAEPVVAALPELQPVFGDKRCVRAVALAQRALDRAAVVRVHEPHPILMRLADLLAAVTEHAPHALPP
ncbi:MAG: hypothetical protein BWX86_02896 [Verrucomicrobia bacterium ADurb.Bin122]|nr:MAG: hypothetical protein BWX86_02896 [Verrucomicrobia bacterium ADurb.Bin122]